MSHAIKAIETTGTMDNKNRIILDEPVEKKKKKNVRVIILFTEDNDIPERDWQIAASKNPVFGFLKEPDEDIYSTKDGKPFDAKG